MAKGTRWPSAHAGDLAALICRRWRGYQHRQELSPWLHPNNKALSWLEATTGQWPFPPPWRHILYTASLWFGSPCVYENNGLFQLVPQPKSKISASRKLSLKVRVNLSERCFFKELHSCQLTNFSLSFFWFLWVSVCILLKAPYYAKYHFTNVFQQQSRCLIVTFQKVCSKTCSSRLCDVTTGADTWMIPFFKYWLRPLRPPCVYPLPKMWKVQQCVSFAGCCKQSAKGVVVLRNLV